jgi:uncharacterized protein YjbI with pentapeptide repeats
MNDTEIPALRPANDNPWYCLATLHGEQPIDGFDQILAEKNQTEWNRWMGGGLSVEQRTNFAHRSLLRPPVSGELPDFSRTHFDRRVSFSNFQFSKPTDFRGASFSDEANFSAAQFQTVDFSSAAFSAEANFRSAQFHQRVDFQSATFTRTADFESAHFNYPNFRSVTFFEYADFESATFTGVTGFESAKFLHVADFNKAKFYGVADFRSAVFSMTANFISAAFSDTSNFTAAMFSSYIHFINAKFAGNTIFANARFDSRVPDFRGATMHEATEWHGIAWPKPLGSKDDAQQQVYAYERLKQEMERLKKHEDEQGFFRRELRARRGLSQTLSWGWFLNLAYQLSSNYGNSIGRPMLWLLGVFAAGAAIFAQAPIHCGMSMPTRLAIKLSFANIFVFLPDKREIMTPEMITCLSDTTRAVSALQSVSGVALLFLLGLALRNRFRMK